MFEAMQFSDGEVYLWVSVLPCFWGDKHYHNDVNLHLLKTFKVDRELTFDELYNLVIQFV